MVENKIGTPDWIRHMEGILEELNEGVAIVDDQLRIIFSNEALERMGQYRPGELQWRNLDAIFPPKDIPRILKQHESGIRNGHSRAEFYVPAKNGDRIPAILSGRPIRSPDGQEHMLVTVTDISAQKRVEEQIRESNALLEQRYKEMETELSLAARVQQSLAPQSLVWNDVLIDSYYSPARTIGGDFGVVFPHGHELLSVLLCDVSGHGIGSALMANRIYSETLHQLERKSTPIELLNHVHTFVYDRLATESFYFTMAAVRLSTRGRRAYFASAGHPPAILLSNGVIRRLESQNGILGCLAETAPSQPETEVDLASGDRLLLYTDGLVEVFNAHEEMLGIEGFSQLVLDAADRPVSEMREAIIRGVADWRRGPLADDVSLIIVEIR